MHKNPNEANFSCIVPRLRRYKPLLVSLTRYLHKTIKKPVIKSNYQGEYHNKRAAEWSLFDYCRYILAQSETFKPCCTWTWTTRGPSATPLSATQYNTCMWYTAPFNISKCILYMAPHSANHRYNFIGIETEFGMCAELVMHWDFGLAMNLIV